MAEDDFEFEFPPDPIAAANSTLPPLHTLPMSMLSQTPTEQLPRTVPPRVERLSIRQMMRSAMTLPAWHTGRRQHVATDGADEFALDGHAPTTAGTTEGGSSGEPISHATGGIRWGLNGTTQKRLEWKEGDVRKFYDALSQYGTDFSAIAVLYPNFDRNAVKRLYHRELRRHPDRVKAALENKVEIDVEAFQENLKEKQLRNEPAKKVLEAEEEDLLRMIAADDPAIRGTADDFDFSSGAFEAAAGEATTPEKGVKKGKKRGRLSVSKITDEEIATLLEPAAVRDDTQQPPCVGTATQDPFCDMKPEGTFAEAALHQWSAEGGGESANDFAFDDF